jgi:hypothetical protein
MPINLYVMTLTIALVLVATTLRAEVPLFPLNEVVQKVKDEIKYAIASDNDSLKIQIDGWDLELSVVTKRDVKGGLSILVAGVELGGSAGLQKEDTQTIKISLVPDHGKVVVDSKPEFLHLANAIKTVKEAIRTAQREPPSFTLDKFDLETEFAVEKEIGGKIKFLILELGQAGFKRFATHKIKIHMSIAK